MKNMKTTSTIFTLALLAISFNSCKKCHECHYEDASDNKIEIGEYCDDQLTEVESNGYSVNDTTYEVHCHDH